MPLLTIVRRSVFAAFLLSWIAMPAAAQQAAPPQDDQAPPEVIALHLNDGSIIVGEILSEADGKVRVRTKTLGEVTLDSEDVERRGPIESTPKAVTTHAAEAAAPPAPTAASTWTRAITTSSSLVSAPFTQGTINSAVPGLTGAALRLPGAQKMFQLGFTVRHTSAHTTFSLSGSGLFVDTEPLGRVSEATSVDLRYSKLFTPRSYVISSTTYRRDAVRNIDNSFAELAGFGYKLVKNAKVQFDVAAGGALLRENKNTPYDDRLQPQVGMMEAFLIQFTPRAYLTNRVTYRAGLRDQEVWNLESYTGIQAAITSHFSIVSGLTWNYDNVLGDAITPIPAGSLFPGSPPLSLRVSLRTYRQFTSGIQFTF